MHGGGGGGGSSDKRRNSRLIKPFETKNHTTVIYNSLYQLTQLIFICHITLIPYLPLWVKKKGPVTQTGEKNIITKSRAADYLLTHGQIL